MQNAGAAGLAAIIPSKQAASSDKTHQNKTPKVPKRKLGKTGIEIPVMTLGAEFLDIDNQILLHKSLDYGVNCWDTAHLYMNGNSELAIGKYLQKNPDARKNIILVSKASGARGKSKPEEAVAMMEQRLQESLKRLNTNYIDIYYGIHGCVTPGHFMRKGIREWALDARKRGLIRHFGFSTHVNMAKLMIAASKTDFIDVIMPVYNFRLAQDKLMQKAIDACRKADIGLIAMKAIALPTKGHPISKFETEEDKKLAQKFLQKGYTEFQAKIKIVMQDERFSSVCVGINTINSLNEDVAAALDKNKLSLDTIDAFNNYAKATCDGYCAGCGQICNSVLPDMPYISEIMRYLMYYNGYGQKEKAKTLFAQLPEKFKQKLAHSNFSKIESLCPQHMPIQNLVTEAIHKLT